jgi:transcription initiation factor IIE alpha subunit
MMPAPQANHIERQVAAETLAAALSPLSVRAIQQRLERILIDDRELLISLQCQLEQIRRELRLLNDDRIVRVLDGQDRPISN